MKKRIISMLLAIIMVIGLVPTMAFTALGADGNEDYSDSIVTQSTASIRISSERPGLRFKTHIKISTIETLVATYGAENVSVGTLIVPSDMLENNALTHDSSVNYIDVKANIDQPFSVEGENNIYAGSIVNIKFANLERNFTAVGYVKIIDGENIIHSYSQTSCVRNVSGIAEAALADTKTTEQEGYEHEVSEGVWSPYSAAEIEIINALVYKIDTYDELKAAVNAGGDVSIGGDIDMGNNYIYIPNVTLNLDLGGFTLNSTYSHAIYNTGTLTISNGAVTGGSYAIYASSGTLKLIGDNLSLSGEYSAPVNWTSSNAKIDLTEYTGENFMFESARANMPLENIILPEGWKLYDRSNNELTATTQWGVIVAKPEING